MLIGYAAVYEGQTSCELTTQVEQLSHFGVSDDCIHIDGAFGCDDNHLMLGEILEVADETDTVVVPHLSVLGNNQDSIVNNLLSLKNSGVKVVCTSPHPEARGKSNLINVTSQHSGDWFECKSAKTCLSCTGNESCLYLTLIQDELKQS